MNIEERLREWLTAVQPKDHSEAQRQKNARLQQQTPRPTPPSSSSSSDELKEKLASIEHERWADWQQYMFDCAVKSGDDNIGVRTCGWPTAQFEHWQRQIETDYEDLSDKEKDSDREQVDRYWPLIQAEITKAQGQAFVAGFKISGEGWNGEYPYGDRGTDPTEDLQKYIAEYKAQLKQGVHHGK